MFQEIQKKLQRVTLSDMVTDLVLTAAIDGLLWLVVKAFKLEIDIRYFIAGVSPLAFVGLTVLRRIAPRRPAISARLLRISVNPDKAGPPADIHVVAQVTNTGHQTGLDDWHLVLTRGKIEHRAEVKVFAVNPRFLQANGSLMELDPNMSLSIQTFLPIPRGGMRKGWMICESDTFARDTILNGGVKVALRCTDAFGKKWTFDVDHGEFTPGTQGVALPPGISFRIYPAKRPTAPPTAKPVAVVPVPPTPPEPLDPPLVPTFEPVRCVGCGGFPLGEFYGRQVGPDGNPGETCSVCGFGPGPGVDRVGDMIIGRKPDRK